MTRTRRISRSLAADLGIKHARIGINDGLPAHSGSGQGRTWAGWMDEWLDGYYARQTAHGRAHIRDFCQQDSAGQLGAGRNKISRIHWRGPQVSLSLGKKEKHFERTNTLETLGCSRNLNLTWLPASCHHLLIFIPPRFCSFAEFLPRKKSFKCTPEHNALALSCCASALTASFRPSALSIFRISEWH